MITQQTFTLEDGRVRTAWSSGTAKPQALILLLHGFPDISDGWVPIMKILAAKYPNALILAPKMKGYEESSTGLPTSEYSMEKLAEEVVMWTHLANDAPVHLVGHDWGAVTIYRAFNLYPKLFTSITTMAIPHSSFASTAYALFKAPKQLYLSSYFLTMNLPFIYRPRISHKTPIPYIQGLIEYWSPTYNMPSKDLADICDTLHIKGVMDSTTAYYRNIWRVVGPWKWSISDWSRVKIIGGRQDQCMCVELFELDKALHPDNVVIIDHVGHFMQREDPQRLAKEIIANIGE